MAGPWQDTEEVEVSVNVPDNTAKADVKALQWQRKTGREATVINRAKLPGAISAEIPEGLFALCLSEMQAAPRKVLHSGKTLVDGALASPCCPEG